MQLEKHLDKTVRDLTAPHATDLIEEQKERHRIYSLMLMAITRYYWNGNKSGCGGTYPLNPSVSGGDTAPFLEGDYIGHNIASIAVDGVGRVIDFDFNHNELFNSSAEHAEARLVRRVFSITQAHDSWNFTGEQFAPLRYGNLLKAVTVYTTLESCSQCSGVMALGQVNEVVFLQDDPGMYRIGNILRHLTEGTNLLAPLPIPGSDIGVPQYAVLNREFISFAEQQATKMGTPFFQRTNGHADYSSSITSFLCTLAAYQAMFEAENQFDALTPGSLAFPNYAPPGCNTLSNAQALLEARSFRQYAIGRGCRATPHH